MIKLFESFKIKPILFLAVFPICYSFVFYAIPKITGVYVSTLTLIPLVFLAISIDYSVIPMKHDAKTFFNKHGFDRIVHDYYFLQNLLIILVTLTIISNVVRYVWFMEELDWENYFLSQEYYANSISTGFAMMTLSTSARFALSFLKKKTKYYLAKICFQLCYENDDDTQKVKFLRLGIDFYNQFIRRNSMIKIQNTGQIYSKFISFNKTEKRTKVKSIIKSFEKGQDLEPFKQLKKSFGIQDESVTESKLINGLKRILLILIATIAGVTTILLNLGGIFDKFKIFF